MAKNFVSYGKYRVASNFDGKDSQGDHLLESGPYVALSVNSNEPITILEGKEGDEIGEFLWIGEDSSAKAGRRDLSDEGTISTFSHIIIGVTTNFNNINFYKIIELANGTHSVFEYKTNAIQTSFSDKKIGYQPASLSFGSFMWTEPNGEGSLIAKQVRICNSRQFYNDTSQVCETCQGEYNGTTEF